MVKNRFAKIMVIAVLVCASFTLMAFLAGCSSSSEDESTSDVRTGGNFYYADTSEGSGEVVIMGIVNPGAIGKTLEIPRTIGSKKVVAIGENAFNSMDRLTAVTLPDTLKTIGKQAFYNCNYITTIVIPASVTYVGEGAFDSCDALKTVEFEHGCSVEVIEKRAFNECVSLESIKLPSSLKKIGEYAFCDAESLTEIELSVNLESIGSYAFCACDKLTEIFIPASVTEMGAHVFQGCKSITIYAGSESAPSTWDKNWNSFGCKVEWRG